MVVVSIVTIIVIGIKASASIKDEIENGLISTALAMRDDVSSIDGNNYWVDEAGNLWNGSDYNITEDTEGIDEVLEKTGIAVTVFFGDTRYSTSVKDASGKRILGTQASPEVTQEVLVKGNEYFSSNASVNGEKYFAYYEPVIGNDGSIIGMYFCWSGGCKCKQSSTAACEYLSGNHHCFSYYCCIYRKLFGIKNEQAL